MNLEIKKSCAVLKNGKTLLYPTDTVWGLGCDATNETAVAKIYDIKQREESKSLIILVDSLEMLRNYVENVPLKALEIIETSKKPITIIYNNPQGLAKNVIANDNTVAIRIVKDKFCQALIIELGKPIVSTSANISGDRTPKTFKEIDGAILDSVDYVVNLRRNETALNSSRIIRILDANEIEVLRD